MDNVGSKPTCPKCGNTEIRKYGWKILAGGNKVQMHQCKQCGSYFRNKAFAEVSRPYHYARFRWWSRVNLKDLAEDLSKEFEVEQQLLPTDETELALHKDEREELKVSANTLTAMLSAFRAVLYQKEGAPFTKKDVKLREKVLELYPRKRSTPVPIPLISVEPKIEAT